MWFRPPVFVHDPLLCLLSVFLVRYDSLLVGHGDPACGVDPRWPFFAAAGLFGVVPFELIMTWDVFPVVVGEVHVRVGVWDRLVFFCPFPCDESYWPSRAHLEV